MWTYLYSDLGKLALSLFGTLKDNVIQTRYGPHALGQWISYCMFCPQQVLLRTRSHMGPGQNRAVATPHLLGKQV